MIRDNTTMGMVWHLHVHLSMLKFGLTKGRGRAPTSGRPYTHLIVKLWSPARITEGFWPIRTRFWKTPGDGWMNELVGKQFERPLFSSQFPAWRSSEYSGFFTIRVWHGSLKTAISITYWVSPFPLSRHSGRPKLPDFKETGQLQMKFLKLLLYFLITKTSLTKRSFHKSGARN